MRQLAWAALVAALGCVACSSGDSPTAPPEDGGGDSAAPVAEVKLIFEKIPGSEPGTMIPTDERARQFGSQVGLSAAWLDQRFVSVTCANVTDLALFFGEHRLVDVECHRNGKIVTVVTPCKLLVAQGTRFVSPDLDTFSLRGNDSLGQRVETVLMDTRPTTEGGTQGPQHLHLVEERGRCR